MENVVLPAFKGVCLRQLLRGVRVLFATAAAAVVVRWVFDRFVRTTRSPLRKCGRTFCFGCTAVSSLVGSGGVW